MSRPFIEPENRKCVVVSTRVTDDFNERLNRVASRLKGQKNLKKARAELFRIALENLLAKVERKTK